MSSTHRPSSPPPPKQTLTLTLTLVNPQPKKAYPNLFALTPVATHSKPPPNTLPKPSPTTQPNLFAPFIILTCCRPPPPVPVPPPPETVAVNGSTPASHRAILGESRQRSDQPEDRPETPASLRDVIGRKKRETNKRTNKQTEKRRVLHSERTKNEKIIFGKHFTSSIYLFID